MSVLADTFSVGVVGAGYFGRFHIDAWRRVAGARITAVCDRDAARVQKEMLETQGEKISRCYASLCEMLEHGVPDVLDITTPPQTHLAVITEAAGRVPHIVCQKPFCGGLEGARRALAICEAAGTKIAVHENVRFQPWYRVMRRLIDDGAIGEPYQIAFRLRPGDGQGADAYLDRQPYFREMPRFLIHETAIHWIDTFRYLFGEIDGLSAHLIRRNPAIAGEDGGAIFFRFASGATGLFDGNRLADHAAANTRLTLGEMVIEGADGSLQLNGDGSVRHRAFGAETPSQVSFDWRDHHFGGDCVYLCTQAIVDAWQNETAPETDAAAYLRNMEVADAVYASAETGRTIDLQRARRS
ncbi:MAG: Gfo/Idh/MocA family oxidoreductase [Pseudomonadota bacterium]